MKIYIKRILEVEIPIAQETPLELLEIAKKKTYPEKLISDTFIVEGDEGIILEKDKVTPGDEHVFVEG